MKAFQACVAGLVFLFALSVMAESRTVWLDQLDLGQMRQGWGKPVANHSVVSMPLRLNGTTYERGVGSHAPGGFHVILDGNAERFQAVVGIDDETVGRGSATVKIYSDKGGLLFDSGVLKPNQPPQQIDADIRGVNRIAVIVGAADNGNAYDHLDWADARFIVAGADPQLVSAPPEEKVILTPKPARTPRINGPRLYGVRPGSPFLFRIPATGERPIQFSVQSLPEGLKLDSDTAIISGTIADLTPKAYETTLIAQNALGKAERPFRIVVGDTLALTPPMGWNHWYAHYHNVTDKMMRESADIMVSTGMADVGYAYVNIDDCWMNTAKHADPLRVGPFRDENGEILPNKHFPDMKALTDYVHSKGLKAGLYTSPGPTTCAGFAGSYQHEEQDAETFARWGFDFLKYDWCSYGQIAKGESLEEFKKPYILMGGILERLDRDIVLNLCQYGMGEVWKWGSEVGGHCWRTAGDLGFELTQYHDVASRNAEHWPHAHPGAWNDPDYLLIGAVGDAATLSKPIPCPLTPNEQYSYMSLWCLMASPLFYSGDMPSLDEFTLNVLCNPEVIDIDQDPLGKQGYCVAKHGDAEIWRKELEGGDVAIGMFNRGEFESPVTLNWTDASLNGKQLLRDLWRQTDLGIFDTEFTAPIPRHGVMLLGATPE
ncbi:MAG: NPCBM/NEW2 domain-containing protein [Candidatus Hydrogenedentes bacterium]|nr:NPCBM/NEW2 domain-containing protein [Candidatus Hydrogenedentota bacterium]